MGKYVSIRKITHILSGRGIGHGVTLVCKYNTITLYVQRALSRMGSTPSFATRTIRFAGKQIATRIYDRVIIILFSTSVLTGRNLSAVDESNRRKNKASFKNGLENDFPKSNTYIHTRPYHHT